MTNNAMSSEINKIEVGFALVIFLLGILLAIIVVSAIFVFDVTEYFSSTSDMEQKGGIYRKIFPAILFYVGTGLLLGILLDLAKKTASMVRMQTRRVFSLMMLIVCGNLAIGLYIGTLSITPILLWLVPAVVFVTSTTLIHWFLSKT